LRITGQDLLGLGVVDEVLPEPSGGNNWAPLEAGATLREALERNLSELGALPQQELRDQRYQKFRVMGRFLDPTSSEGDSAS
jgi:acetyl-CoA carboxylase carboxyl transferase subunit alpha